jgi:glycosyltransferase involved in cell wall biosynthesis
MKEQALHGEMSHPEHYLTDDTPLVLHVRVMAGSGGGPEKTIIRSPGYVDPERYRIEAAYIYPQGDEGITEFLHQAADRQCMVYPIGERCPIDRQSFTRIMELCRQLNVAIWHGHDYKSNLLGLMIARHHPMRLITTVHGWTDDTWRMRLYRRIDLWCLRRYERVVTVSQKLADQCRAARVDPQRLSVIPNGIELDDYTVTRTRFEAQHALDIPQNTRIIGVVGRLSHEKAADRALTALASLRRDLPDTCMLLIGDGPTRLELESQAAQLGLHDSVRFCGWQQPVQPWYEAMDLLLLPSRTEGLPNAVLEAMAMGVPVAATDVGGVRDLLDNGRCGVILGADPQQWAKPIGKLLGNPVRCEQYAMAARSRVKTHFSFRTRMQRMVALYDQLLGRAVQPHRAAA